MQKKKVQKKYSLPIPFFFGPKSGPSPSSYSSTFPLPYPSLEVTIAGECLSPDLRGAKLLRPKSHFTGDLD